MYQTERDETSGILKKLEGDEDSVLALFFILLLLLFYEINY